MNWFDIGIGEMFADKNTAATVVHGGTNIIGNKGNVDQVGDKHIGVNSNEIERMKLELEFKDKELAAKDEQIGLLKQMIEILKNK